MENILIGLFSSLLVLDTTVIFQVLISQPLFACALLGLCMGDLQMGIQVGSLLQLLWLSSIPVGAAIVPEGNLAALICTAMVIRYHNGYLHFDSVLVFSLLFGLLVSFLGGELVVLYRRINVWLLNRLLRSLKTGATSVLEHTVGGSIIIHFLLVFALTVLALSAGDLFFGNIYHFPSAWEKVFRYGTIALLGIGTGLVAAFYKDRSAWYIIPVGILAGCLIFMI